MTGPNEYELTGTELDVYELFLTEAKEAEIHTAALNLAKAMLKKVGGDAEYLTVDGERVLQVVRSRPSRFDGAALRRFDPRLYERFVVTSDSEVVSLRRVGKS